MNEYWTRALPHSLLITYLPVFRYQWIHFHIPIPASIPLPMDTLPHSHTCQYSATNGYTSTFPYLPVIRYQWIHFHIPFKSHTCQYSATSSLCPARSFVSVTNLAKHLTEEYLIHNHTHTHTRHKLSCSYTIYYICARYTGRAYDKTESEVSSRLTY